MRRRKALARALVSLLAVVQCAKAAPAMDQVRRTTRSDEAVSKHAVSRRGVTVAVLDRGIDWRHPDFIRADGKTRVKWLGSAWQKPERQALTCLRAGPYHGRGHFCRWSSAEEKADETTRSRFPSGSPTRFSAIGK